MPGADRVGAGRDDDRSGPCCPRMPPRAATAVEGAGQERAMPRCRDTGTVVGWRRGRSGRPCHPVALLVADADGRPGDGRRTGPWHRGLRRTAKSCGVRAVDEVPLGGAAAGARRLRARPRVSDWDEPGRPRVPGSPTTPTITRTRSGGAQAGWARLGQGSQRPSRGQLSRTATPGRRRGAGRPASTSRSARGRGAPRRPGTARPGAPRPAPRARPPRRSTGSAGWGSRR